MQGCLRDPAPVPRAAAPIPPPSPCRAVAGECARVSPVPVTLFARKGADCLGKYAGDAERTLRLIFDEVRIGGGSGTDLYLDLGRI